MATSKNKILTHIIRIAGSLISVILLCLLIFEQGWDEIYDALSTISPLYLFIGIVLIIISRLFTIGRWLVLLSGAKLKVSIKDITSISFAGLFASNFLPSTIGGDVIRMVGIMGLGYDRAICAASIAADRLVGMIGMFFFAPFGIFPLLKISTISNTVGITFPIEKIKHFFLRTIKTMHLWLQQPATLLKAFIMTFGNMIFLFLALQIFAKGLSANLPFTLVAGAWSLIYFVTLIPISINGYGVQELSTTFFFVTLGGMTIPQSVALAVLIRTALIIASLPGAFFIPEALKSISQKMYSE